MSGVLRSLDDGQLALLISQPCETLAALMTAQLPAASPALAEGLAKLDEARACFIRATRPERQPA